MGRLLSTTGLAVLLGLGCAFRNKVEISSVNQGQMTELQKLAGNEFFRIICQNERGEFTEESRRFVLNSFRAPIGYKLVGGYLGYNLQGSSCIFYRFVRKEEPKPFQPIEEPNSAYERHFPAADFKQF